MNKIKNLETRANGIQVGTNKYSKTSDIHKVGTKLTIDSTDSARGTPTDTASIFTNGRHAGNIKNQNKIIDNKDSKHSSSNESATLGIIERINIIVDNVNTIVELNHKGTALIGLCRVLRTVYALYIDLSIISFIHHYYNNDNVTNSANPNMTCDGTEIKKGPIQIIEKMTTMLHCFIKTVLFIMTAETCFGLLMGVLTIRFIQ